MKKMSETGLKKITSNAVGLSVYLMMSLPVWSMPPGGGLGAAPGPHGPAPDLAQRLKLLSFICYGASLQDVKQVLEPFSKHPGSLNYEHQIKEYQGGQPTGKYLRYLSPLKAAIATKNLNVFRALIDCKADVNFAHNPDRQAFNPVVHMGLSPLWMVLEQVPPGMELGKNDIIHVMAKELVEAGALINVRTPDGRMLMDLALEKSSPWIVEFLCKNKSFLGINHLRERLVFSITETNNQGDRVIIKTKSYWFTSRLIQNGTQKLYYLCNDGACPYLLGIQPVRCPQCVSNPNLSGYCQPSSYYSPLSRAIVEGKQDIIDALLKHKADPNLQSKYQNQDGSWSYFSTLATCRKNVPLELLSFQKLIDKGADPWAKSGQDLSSPGDYILKHQEEYDGELIEVLKLIKKQQRFKLLAYAQPQMRQVQALSGATQSHNVQARAQSAERPGALSAAGSRREESRMEEAGAGSVERQTMGRWKVDVPDSGVSNESIQLCLIPRKEGQASEVASELEQDGVRPKRVKYTLQIACSDGAQLENTNCQRKKKGCFELSADLVGQQLAEKRVSVSICELDDDAATEDLGGGR